MNLTLNCSARLSELRSWGGGRPRSSRGGEARPGLLLSVQWALPDLVQLDNADSETVSASQCDSLWRSQISPFIFKVKAFTEPRNTQTLSSPLPL